MQKYAALIPAAGFSSRMGDFKPLLPLGKGTVLSQCIELFHSCGVAQIIIVSGNRHSDIALAAEAVGASCVYNSTFTEGMFSSIQCGAASISSDVDAFFVLPVDMPLVRRETVLHLIAAFETLLPSVLYPKYLGERGHPPLIARSVLPQILGGTGHGGLRKVLEAFDASAHELDVPDSGIMHDLDYKTDYHHALSRLNTGYPSEGECRQLWEMQQVHPHIVAHCKAVAHVAEALGRAFNEQQEGDVLDLELIRGAALTHDIGKGGKQHESVGAQLLQRYGFERAAEIVATHFDIELTDGMPITEKETVFLADKLVRCDSPVTMENRYLEKVAIHKHELGAQEAILARLCRAQVILHRFDQEIGMSSELLAQEVLG